MPSDAGCDGRLNGKLNQYKNNVCNTTERYLKVTEADFQNCAEVELEGKQYNPSELSLNGLTGKGTLQDSKISNPDPEPMQQYEPQANVSHKDSR